MIGIHCTRSNISCLGCPPIFVDNVLYWLCWRIPGFSIEGSRQAPREASVVQENRQE